MKLIAGLGNPGKEYAKTRHNSGFMAVDALAKSLGTEITSEKWEALSTVVRKSGEQVILLKPMTYMNDSGRSIAQVVRFYKLEPKDILIIHDDMDLPAGSVRIRARGSSGGQKGMKSILQALGTEEIARIRIGVGHSEPGNHDKVPDWVLSAMPKAQQEAFDHAIQQAADAAWAWVDRPFEEVMTRYNLKVKKEKAE